jgi:hypothetical protein
MIYKVSVINPFNKPVTFVLCAPRQEAEDKADKLEKKYPTCSVVIEEFTDTMKLPLVVN